MAENTEQSPKRMELSLTQDSNEPALSKHFPTILRSALEAELKLRRKEQHFSTIFENNAKCGPVFCNKSCSQEELKAQLSALAQEWLHQALPIELMQAVTDEQAPHADALIKLPAVKVVVDNHDDNRIYYAWQELRARTDKDTAAAMSQELATNVDPKFGHWGYKATLPMGPVYIYGDVCHLMLAQSEKMGASLSDIVRHMTLVLPTQVIPFFTAKKSGFISAYEMLKVAFPELKIITLPELDQEQCALLICDDPAYGKPGYLVLQDGSPIKAFDRDELLTTVKYELFIPAHKVVITNPEQIAVLEGI